MIQVTKENLDNYEGGPAVPAFQIELKMIESKPLVQKVNFVGITPKSYVTITREPRSRGTLHDLYCIMLMIHSFPATTVEEHV